MRSDFMAFRANGKVAGFRFMPGWGEPGEWLIQLDKSTLTLNNVEGQTNQLEYLERFVSDEYRLQVFAANWTREGTREDAIRHCLEYTGYNDENREHDMRIVESLESLVLVNSDALGIFFDEIPADAVNSFGYLSTLSVNYRNEILADAIKREQVVAVYDRLQKGETVDIGWSNETLIRDYPSSREAKLAEDFLQGKINITGATS